MIYSINISSDYIIIEENVSNLHWQNDFTLTVNAVNDAPFLLQPFECLEILGDSGAAALVHRTPFSDLSPLIYSDDLHWQNDFTLTVNAVNDAPFLLQPFECLEILGDSGAAALVHSTE